MKSKSKSKGKASGNKPQQQNASGRNQSRVFEATSKRGNSSNAQNYSQSNSGYDALWGDDAFPALGASAAVPDFNVWEERKAKMESVIALQPQNEYDEQAMLQQALAMSLLEEEERKKREEEELALQMEAANYKNAKRELEYFNAVDGTAASSLSESQFGKTEHSKESIPRNTASAFNQKDKPLNSSGSKPKINKIIDSFGGWGLKNDKNTSGKMSEFVNEVVDDSSTRQPGKQRALSSYDSSSTEKKAIGVGRNTKVESRENCWPSQVGKQPADSGTWEDGESLHSLVSRNESSHIEKKAVGSGRNISVESRESTWSSEAKKNLAELDSWENEEVLYNGKGTFTDIDDVQLNDLSIKDKHESSELPNVSPNRVLDTWINADDYENDGNLNNEKKSLSNDCVNSEEIHFVDTATSIPLNTYLSSPEKFKDGRDCNSGKARNQICDTFDVLNQEKSENDSWASSKEVITPRESIISQNNVNDHSTDNTYSFETTKTSLESNNNIWANPSSTNSPFFSSFPGNLPNTKHDEMPIKFSTDAQNEFFNDESSAQADIPPILPPKPVPVAPEENINIENKVYASEASNASSKDDSPNIFPPPPAPGLQPQSLPMNNPLLNPACMIPGFDPLFSCGLDPITMRQMLLLSNPFFASQLCAMEQYYRSMGMQVDLFSFPARPNVMPPAMLNMGLGLLPNTANAFMQSTPLLPQFQNPLNNNLFTSESQNNVSSGQNSFERSGGNLSESGVAASSTNAENVLQKEKDSWYESYLSSDCSEAIPPPKPSAYNSSDVIPPPKPSAYINSEFIPQPTAYSNSEAIPPPTASTCSNSKAKFSQFNQCASQLNGNDLTVNKHTSANYASYAPETNADNKQKTLTAIEACTSKTVVTGWDDSDEEVVSVHKTTSKWDDDDSWGDPVPTKSLKNTHDGKRVCRQPVRPPQLSHFQKNKH